MKFLGNVPQFYTQKFDENGVLQIRKGTNGHRCNSCHDLLLSSSVKTSRKILLKRSALFQNMVDIQYKPTLVKSNQSDICSFVKSPWSSIFSSGMQLLHQSKCHLDLCINLKLRLPKQKLCPSRYLIIQVLGDYTFLKVFIHLYTENPAFKKSLYVCLL